MPTPAPIDPLGVLMLAALNPIVIVVALLMGRSADQRQKLVIAAFAAAFAGSVALTIAVYLRLLPPRPPGTEAGIFLAQCVLGLAWATLGYWLRRRA